MSKINIIFNDTDYAIEESALASPKAELETHLSSIMNGSGSIIKLGDLSYNIDSTKLATTMNNFVSHLGTIVGSGEKVIINGIEYEVDSTKIASALSELEYTLRKLASSEDEITSPIYKASITGLGNESPTSQTYTMDEGFPTSFEEVTDSLGNIFIKIPTMYRKIDNVVDGQITAFTMSTVKEDDTYVPYSVFVKPDGSVMPYVLIGKYCYNSTTSANSISSENASIKIEDARTYAQALGDGYQIYDWQFQKLFVDLCLLISQKVNFNSGAEITSYLGVDCLRYSVGIDGLSSDGTTWCIAYDPSKYVNQATSDTDGYIAASYTAPADSLVEIKKLGYDANNPFFNYPSECVSNSSYNTYYCDQYTFNSSVNAGITSAIGYPSTKYGLWKYQPIFWATGSSKASARLCYRPLEEEIQ